MLQKLCLMASHGYPPGLVLQKHLDMNGSSILKGSQPSLSSPAAKPEIISYGSASRGSNSCEESRKFQSEWFNCNQFVSVDSLAERPMLVGVQATFPNALLFGSGIAEQCTKYEKVLQLLMSGNSEAEIGGEHISLLSELMDLPLSGGDEPQQPFSPLIYPNSEFYTQKPSLDFVQDSALTSKITVHPDGQVTFLGTAIDMKDLLAVVAEAYLSKNSRKGEKRSMLVPHFNRLIFSEAEARSDSSTLKIQSTLTAPLRSPEKVKVKPSPKKNKKAGRERDLYKKNYLHACESLLSLMVDKKQHRKTAILSLRKLGPELPELLTQFSAGIAGIGLAILLTVICKVACGSVPFRTTKFFNTGFGFGLVWLSWAVNELRDTIVNISKNAGRFALKDDEMIQKLDKSIRDIYFGTAALLAVAVLRLA